MGSQAPATPFPKLLQNRIDIQAICAAELNERNAGRLVGLRWLEVNWLRERSHVAVHLLPPQVLAKTFWKASKGRLLAEATADGSRACRVIYSSSESPASCCHRWLRAKQGAGLVEKAIVSAFLSGAWSRAGAKSMYCSGTESLQL